MTTRALSTSAPVQRPDGHAGTAPRDGVAAAAAQARPSVALVAVGIGKVRRGYERYFADLFEALRPHASCTLYVGGGELGEGRRTPRGLGVATALARWAPVRRVTGGSEYAGYERECLAYAIALVPSLVRGEHDVVHVIDYPLAKHLARLSRLVPMRSRLIFCNACAAPPRWCPRLAHVQHIAEPFYREALASADARGALHLAPCGVHTGRFRCHETRDALRARHGVAPAERVVLCVSAVKRVHKRVDAVIDAFERAFAPASGPGPGGVADEDGGAAPVTLWIDGSPEDPSLIEEATRRLGTRCHVTHVPTARVPELLGLADVFVHGAVEEAFGLSIVEALSAGLPVVVHDSPHFRWLAGAAGRFVDVRDAGAFAAALRAAVRELDDGAGRGADAMRAQQAAARFDWEAVLPAYLSMYARVSQGARGGGA